MIEVSKSRDRRAGPRRGLLGAVSTLAVVGASLVAAQPAFAVTPITGLTATSVPGEQSLTVTVHPTGAGGAVADSGWDHVLATVSGHLDQVTSTLAPFSAGDVGRMITATGTTAALPAGTYIQSVSSGTATLSNAFPSAVTTGAVSIYPAKPVENGTYTVTVVSNGAPGAQLSTTIPYFQTIISSGSTFTVSDYLHLH